MTHAAPTPLVTTADEPVSMSPPASRPARRRARFVGGTGRWIDVAAVAGGLLRRGEGDEERSLGRWHADLRNYLGATHVFSYGAARMGLFEMLRVLGVGEREDDEVIVPGFTCAVVINAIKFAGARPVYADIDIDRLSADLDLVRERISGRTRAIIVQHLFGIPCDMQAAMTLGREANLPIIEDAAMALGARIEDRRCGTIGDGGILSTERTKMISTGSGGVLVVNDTRLAERLRVSHAGLTTRGDDRAQRWQWMHDQLRSAPFGGRVWARLLQPLRAVRRRRHGSGRFEFECGDSSLYEEEYAGSRPAGYPWRMSGASAALARRQLGTLDRQIARRHALGRAIDDVLRGKNVGRPAVDWVGTRPSWLRYPFWTEDREEWSRRLTWAGVEQHPQARWFEGPVHPASCTELPWFEYERGACPRGEWLGEHILNIPLSPRIGSWLVRRLKRL